MNPKDALQRLIDGNSRFVSGQTTSHNAAIDRATMSEGQAPFAVVLRCADSRVSPEIVFDQPLGNLFVCAVAGNVPTPEIVESLEYAVGQLSSPLIVVMGHTNCGAVAHATAHLPTKGLFSMIDIPHDDEDAIGGSINKQPVDERFTNTCLIIFHNSYHHSNIMTLKCYFHL